MKVNTVNNTNFKANVKLENEYLYMYRRLCNHNWFRDELKALEESPTNNLYGIKSVSGDKNEKICDVLLNGESFCKAELNPPNYPTLKKFFGIILEKEKSIVAGMKGTDLHTKLESIRSFIKKTGVSLEDAKRYL